MLCWAMAPVCAVQVASAKTAAQHKVELTDWEKAERGLETLDVIPVATRTRVDYTRAMDGFRAVYHGAPGDAHAPDSVNAVAELLADEGRRFHDEKLLKAAVGSMSFCGRSIRGARCGWARCWRRGRFMRTI